MKIKESLTAVLVVGLLLGAGAIWLMPSGTTQAPAVSFTTLDGERITMQELRGRPVLVNFWSTTCVTCIQEMPHLEELHEALGPKGLKVIGVAMSFDPPEQVAAFQERRQLPYTIALDFDSTVAASFGNVSLTPTSFLISPQGRIVYHKIGLLDTEKVARSIDEMTAG
jgi:peroxiredoxin